MQFKKPYQEGDQRLALGRRKKRRHDLEAQHGGMEMHNVKDTNPTFEGPSGRGAISNKQTDG
jgi:hypothetical protein